MLKPIFVTFSLLLLFFACTKIETTDIGNGLIPPIDGVNTKDTFFDIETNTFLDEDVTKIYKGDDHVIGTITNDPLFGKTTASVFFELKPTSYKFAFPGIKDSLKVDSAVLILSYKGAYGDVTVPQTISVHEIIQDSKLKFDSTYNVQTASITYNQNALGTKSNFDIRRLGDSVNNLYENAKNQIRIRLDNSFATRLIKTYDSTAGNAYQSDSLFKTNFAGFALVPGSSGNALLRINLLDTNTKLALYYTSRLETSIKRDSSVSYFRFNLSGSSATSGNANLIRRNRAGSQMNSSLNTGKNDSIIYIQTSPGSYATLKIPGLSSFRNTLIHRAEIVAVQVPDNTNLLDDIFSAPRYLLLTAYDSINRRNLNIPNDYTIASEVPNVQEFGGSHTKRSVPEFGTVSSYTFNLTRYLQGIVTRKEPSYNLRLYAPANDTLIYSNPYPFSSSADTFFIAPTYSNNVADGRVRLAGGSNSRVKLRLRVIYSEL